MIAPEVIDAVRAAVIAHRDVSLAKGLRFDGDDRQRSYAISEAAIDWLEAHIDADLRDRLPPRWRLVALARIHLEQLGN